MRIYTNTLSSVAQNNLATSQKTLGSAIARLSSGLRINSAADDAAGLSISNRMESRIRGKDQALNNLNDGISMLQTIDSGLDAITDNVQRIRELAVQMASDSYSRTDKNAIQNEIDERLASIEKIGNSANFNGLKLSDQNKKISLQIGEDAIDSLDINLKALNIQSLGLDKTKPPMGPAISSQNPLVFPPGTISRYGDDVSGSWENIGKVQILRNVYNESTDSWWSRLLDAEPILGSDISVHPILDESGNFDSAKGVVIKVGDSYYVSTPETKLYSEFDFDKSTFNVTIEYGYDLIRPGSGRVGNIVDVATGETIPYFFDQQQAGLDENNNFVSYVTFTDNKGNEYHIDSKDMKKGITINSNTGENLSTHAVHLAKNDFINQADEALQIIGEFQSYIGAMMNRMDSIGSGLESGGNDLRAAQSRIQDADYAVEISNLTRNQILQQAGQSVLAQANQIPRGILSLLQ